MLSGLGTRMSDPSVYVVFWALIITATQEKASLVYVGAPLEESLDDVRAAAFRGVDQSSLAEAVCLQAKAKPTQRLQCSSFLGMTYLLLRGYNILPKKEQLLSLWVDPQCTFIMVSIRWYLVCLKG